MNECDLSRIFVEHANGLTMVNTMNINIPCDVGSSYHCFVQPAFTSLSISKYPICNLGAILRNATHNFRQQGYTSNYNMNQDKIQCLRYSKLLQYLFLVHPRKDDIAHSKSQLENLQYTIYGKQYCRLLRNLTKLSQVHQRLHYKLE